MTFFDVVMECFDNRELVSNWERLYGMRLVPLPLSAIEKMVDQVTGHVPAAINEDSARAFIAFVRECVWERLPPECFADVRP